LEFRVYAVLTAKVARTARRRNSKRIGLVRVVVLLKYARKPKTFEGICGWIPHEQVEGHNTFAD